VPARCRWTRGSRKSEDRPAARRSDGHGQALFAVAWPVGVIGGWWLLARKIYSAAVRRRRRILRDLLDRPTEQVEAMTAGERLASEPERGLPGPAQS
jgi:hypothetical protein